MEKVLPAIVSLFIFCTSCKQDNNMYAVKAINQHLERTNAIIKEKNEIVHASLEEKIRDPQTKSHALIWNPRALEVSKISATAIAYIDGLKKALFQEENAKEPDELFREKGDELYAKLVAYSKYITDAMQVDSFVDNPAFKNMLDKDIVLFKKDIATRLGLRENDTAATFIDAQTWASRYLSNTTQLQAVTMLTKFQNDVLITENNLVEYCFSNARPGCILSFDAFRAIAVLSSSYVKAGQPIEVTAGVGSFTEASKPSIVIDGKTIEPEGGTSIYTFKATGKPGHHFVPVTISYNKPDGSKAVVNKKLFYVIAE